MSRTVSNSGGTGESTTNHERVRRWADRRDATPARAGAAGDGVLRFSFPDTDRFAEVEWREFFEEFEREGLALVYQPAAEDVEDPNRFYKLVDRATV